MRIVGLKPRKGVAKQTQKPYEGVQVYCCGPARETVGEGVEDQFVDIALFNAATGGKPLKELLGRECLFVRDNRGFLEGFMLMPGEK